MRPDMGEEAPLAGGMPRLSDRWARATPFRASWMRKVEDKEVVRMGI